MDYSFIAGSFASGQAVVLAALVIGLFWTALVHPKRIRSLTQFRVATFMAGFSMVVPLISQILVLQSGGLAGVPGTPSNLVASYVVSMLSPILVMFGIILGVGSVTPSKRQAPS